MQALNLLTPQHRSRPGWVSRALRTVLVLLVILLLHSVLAIVAPRRAELYVLAATALVLPVSYWLRYHFRLMCAVFGLATLLVAASPIDVLVRSDRHGLRVRLLPATYGIACEDDERFACHGCTVPLHRVSWALVISYRAAPRTPGDTLSDSP